MRAFSLEVHSAAGPGLLAIRGSTEGPLVPAVEGEFEPARLGSLLPNEQSFLSTEGTQFRGTFYDVKDTDRETIASLLAILFPDAVGNLDPAQILERTHTATQSFHPVADYVVSAGPPDFLWISTARSASRLTSLKTWVPERVAAAVDRWSLRFRQITLLVIGRAVLVFYSALPEDLGTDSPPQSVRAIQNAARGSYTSGPDDHSPGDIANGYVAAILRRAEDTAREIDQATETWDVEFFDSLNDQYQAAEPVWTHVSRLQPLRTSGAELRQYLDDLKYGDFSWLDYWHDERSTRKDLTEVHQRIDGVQSRLQATGDRIQDSVALGATVSMGRILTLAHDAQGRAEGFQRAATFVTAFVLVPGLMATLYASGIQVPGGASESERSIWLGALALAGAAATVGIVGLYARGRRGFAMCLAAGAVVAIVVAFALGSPQTDGATSKPTEVNAPTRRGP